MPEGTTATDLVLTVVKMLRDKGVVGKFVEFYGEGLKNLTLADRATIANMAPEYGATCGFFPIDEETLKYLRFSGRDENTVNIVEKYAKEQGLWANDQVEFTDTLSLDMSTVVPTISGPKRPQDKVLLTDASTGFKKVFEDATSRKEQHVSKVSGTDYEIKDGSILIAAITSCTNTSNPNVLIGAGLLAKKAVELGLETKPWVKTSLAPGSQVVTDYLAKAAQGEMSDAASRKVRSMLSIINDMERIGDICYQLSITFERKSEKKAYFIPELRTRLEEMITEVQNAIGIMNKNLCSDYSQISITDANGAEQMINKMRNELRKEYLKKIETGEFKIQTGLIYNNLIHSLEKVGDHVYNISEAIEESK